MKQSIPKETGKPRLKTYHKAERCGKWIVFIFGILFLPELLRGKL